MTAMATSDKSIYQFECNNCGELVETSKNDMAMAECRDINEKEGDYQCPGEMILIDSWPIQIV